MRRIYDARCTVCEEITEVFGRESDDFRCGACGSPAKRIVSPVKCKLEGVTGDFPGASIKWERDHVRRAQKG
jgi:Zn finger protein HypA/HybF involved in hydrogenase expression